MIGQIFSWENKNVKKDSISKDSIIAQKVNKDYFVKDTLDFITKSKTIVLDDAVLAKNNKKSFLGNLNTSGAIIRGVTFGNNQGSSVQSSLDLQIAGNLSEDVSVLASISDHNLPIQADGYTQTLDEFDKIYVQLDIKKKSQILAGHLDLEEQRDYFARYQKRSLGLGFKTQFGKDNTNQLDITAGVARSEFHRIRFQGIEGNQGPYRLRGKNNEQFITVISGSEKVYIDGILMKRGENLDYTINYNTGEITFTSFRPIYQQNFITIEYNYTNRNYSRYLFTGRIQHTTEKIKTGFSWFSENDNRNAPLSLNLSDEDKKILAEAGNNQDLMFAPSGVLTEYDNNKILYQKISDPQGDYYEYSNDSNLPLYQVNFTFFGNLKGDYVLKQTTNNGRVFEYVGQNLGSYKAVRKLPSPQKSQVFSTNFAYKIPRGEVGMDFSLSNFDINLFSSKDAADNIGYAGRVFANKIWKNNSWTGKSRLEWQYIDRQFHILDRINDVEFSRDFNLNQEFNQKTQNRLILTMDNRWENTSFINYQLNILNEKDDYNGLKNDLQFGWHKGKWTTDGNASVLSTDSQLEETRFVRGKVETKLNQQKGYWALGAGTEYNKRNLKATTNLDAASFSWKEVFLEKKIGDSLRTYFKGRAYVRQNDSVQANELKKVNNIVGFIGESELVKKQNTTINTLIHYRKINPVEIEDGKNQDFIIGNILFHQKLFNNSMRFRAFYELGNGQEAQREFQYIKVTDGQGIYKWTDYNGDGVQQLDEFEVAEYSDLAQYIRVYTNSIRYLPSNKNKLKLSLFISPAGVLDSDNAFLKRWRLNFSLNSINSYLKNDRVLVANPFESTENQLLKTQNLLANVQFSSTPKNGWVGNYKYIDNDNLINANFSKEESNRKQHFLSLGYIFNEKLRVDVEQNMQTFANKSEVFSNRNYRLKNLGIQPKLTYQLEQNLQTEVWTSFSNKKRTDGEERLKSFNASGAIQWQVRKTTLRADFSFINHRFTGNSFSIVGNQMLDGLKPGKNQVWNLFMIQNISKLLSLNVNYEGRNSGDRTIHIGSVQLKASF